MIEKIQLLMKIHQMSAADMAEKLGTERSGISHFLSGRNKPSLAFVQKLLEKFPELNPDWLLLNKGSMLRSDDNQVVVEKHFIDSTPEFQFPDETEKTIIEIPVVNDEKASAYVVDKQHTNITSAEKQEKTKNNDESIDRIVIFYQNGTFKAYRDL
jgi:transcriptional regulator with XRE-family HTH domain